MKIVFVIGRVLFSAVFFVKGLSQFCPTMIGKAAGMGVPAPHLFMPLWGVLAFVGALSILLGYKAKMGAWILVVFLLPITFLMHAFWDVDTMSMARMHGLCFWKNISLMGALLMIAYTGSGPYSLKR